MLVISGQNGQSQGTSWSTSVETEESARLRPSVAPGQPHHVARTSLRRHIARPTQSRLLAGLDFILVFYPVKSGHNCSFYS